MVDGSLFICEDVNTVFFQSWKNGMQTIFDQLPGMSVPNDANLIINPGSIAVAQRLNDVEGAESHNFYAHDISCTMHTCSLQDLGLDAQWWDRDVNFADKIQRGHCHRQDTGPARFSRDV